MNRDLQSILLKALAQRPNDRYQMAGDMADDLRRYLQHEPVRARNPKFWYVVCKSLWRNRTYAVAVSSVVFLVLGAIAGYVHITNRHAAEALGLASLAETRRQAASLARTRAEQQTYVHQLELARKALDEFDFRLALAILDECPPEQRGWEWQFLMHRASPLDDSYAQIGPFPDAVYRMAFSPDGSKLAVAFGYANIRPVSDPGVRIFRVADGAPISVLQGHQGSVHALAFTPDGTQILTGGRDLSFRRWRVKDGKQLEIRMPETPKDRREENPEALHRSVPFSVAFSPDGQHVAFSVLPEGLFVARSPQTLTWEGIMAAAKRVVPLAASHNIAIRFSEDGKRLAWMATTWHERRGHLYWIDVPSSRVIWEHHGPAAYPYFGLDIDQEASRVITAGASETVSMFAAAGSGESRLLGQLGRHRGRVKSVGFIDGDHEAVSLGIDGILRVWNLETYRTTSATFPDVARQGYGFALDDERIRIAVCSQFPTIIRLWNVEDISRRRDNRMTHHPPKARDFAISSDRTRLASVGDDGVLRMVEWPSATPLWEATGTFPAATAVAFSPDRNVVAAGWSVHPHLRAKPPYGSLQLLDADTGKAVGEPIELPGWVWSIRFVERTNQLLVAYGVGERQFPESSGAAVLIDYSDGSLVRTFKTPSPRCRAAAISPDGRLVATASEQMVTLWETETGREIASRKSSQGGNFVRFIEGGKRLLTGDQADIVVLDASTLGELRRFHRSHVAGGLRLGTIADATFLDDGRRLASASWDGMITIWDANSTQSLLTFFAHENGAHHLRLGLGESAIVSSGHDGGVRLWRIGHEMSTNPAAVR